MAQLQHLKRTNSMLRKTKQTPLPSKIISAILSAKSEKARSQNTSPQLKFIITFANASYLFK